MIARRQSAPFVLNFCYCSLMTHFFLILMAMVLQQPVARFPAVVSSNLEGKSFDLPRDFAGDRNVVFVAFLQKQQADVDTWMPFVKPLVSRTSGTEFYELPTIKKMIGLMRWTINRGMSGGIPDRGARDRTITLYIDKAPFKESLQVTDENTIHVFIVDKAGAILWRSTGRFTEEKGAALAAALVAK